MECGVRRFEMRIAQKIRINKISTRFDGSFLDQNRMPCLPIISVQTEL
jgi:hypothetical protein